MATVAAGGDTEGDHTCALTTAGGAKCWGKNSLRRLWLPYRTTPVDVVDQLRLYLLLIVIQS